MLRTELGLGGSSARTWSLILAIVVSCNVYDASMLTGDSGSKGGTSPSGGTDTEGGSSGTAGSPNGGGSGETGGGGGTSGSAGSTGTGGSQGGNGGTSGSGTEGGEGGEGEGATGGGGAGSGGSAGGGSGGSAGSSGSSGSGGNAGQCGVCGCDMPETDTDGDGVADCVDACEGFDDAHCTVLREGLVHRYSFGGTGTMVTDSKGTADGTAVNATLDGSGTLTLGGGNTSSPPHVDLPNGIISALTNATLEAWVTWNQSGTTGQNWQRIFDFGTSGTEGMQASGSSTSMSYLFLTAKASTSPAGLRAAYTTAGPNAETIAGVATALPTGTMQHVVVVVDDDNDELSLYLNGARQDLAVFNQALAEISDVNNWLGRSQYASDYEFIGVFDEFRIYDVALTSQQIATSHMAGADAAFLD